MVIAYMGIAPQVAGKGKRRGLMVVGSLVTGSSINSPASNIDQWLLEASCLQLRSESVSDIFNTFGLST